MPTTESVGMRSGPAVAPARAADRGARPLRPLARGAGAVHVWTLDPHGPGGHAGDLALLDDAERERAEHYRFERDQQRFVRRHAFTRRILARYLRADPRTIEMETPLHEQPRLARHRDLSFSVSQADDVTAVAVADGRSVGVDIEQVRPIDDVMRLANGLFTTTEVEHLRSLAPASRSSAFLSLWTRKESLVKALGGGLSIPLDRFDVVEQDGHSFVRSHGLDGDGHFITGRLVASRGYVGAVTLAGNRLTIMDMGSGAAG